MTAISAAKYHMPYFRLSRAILHQISNPHFPIYDFTLGVTGGSLHNLNNYGKLR